MPIEELHEDKQIINKQSPDEPRKECSTCRWWSRCEPHPDAISSWGFDSFEFGECRAVPPTALGKDRTRTAEHNGNITVVIKLARFPHTFEDDWCGMWVQG